VPAMDTLDDLLIKRRRGALSPAEERRLRVGLRSSRELEVALLTQEGFERAGAALPLDAELCHQIVGRVAGRGRSIAHARWRKPVMLWVGVPLLIASAAAASMGGYQALSELLHPAVPAPGALTAAGQQRVARTEARALAPELNPGVMAPRGEGSLDAVPLLTEDVPEDVPFVSEHVPHTLPELAPPAPATLRPSRLPEAGSARALFRHANQARHADWGKAEALYARLIQRYPGSSEAATAEMALAKHALTSGRPALALRWFRAHQQRSTSALRVEAIWGEARALEELGAGAEARRVWQRLIDEHAHSTYAQVARQRLAR
jgi:TolA-binding protein